MSDENRTFQTGSAIPRLRRPLFFVLLVVMVLLLLMLVLLCGVLPNFISRLKTTEQPKESLIVTEQPTLPTEDKPTITETTTEQASRGACLDPCDPAAPACQAGLSCLPKSQGSTDYICFNSDICGQTITETSPPPATEAPTDIVVECGPGWLPAGGCVCCGPNLICADGTVGQFNPQCTGGGQTGYCGDGICDPSIGETAANCAECFY